ncbi:hypothetical protein Ocin01_10867 [Orchesella cincta]|uniref:Uncharacterized protein n=1 Tax=Orchesella cincta TaxID=48709 RepID=A0A1D2MSE0_ORCCI|nr:hypothetical protein Ocin01_10867 [Orchesella cincta]
MGLSKGFSTSVLFLFLLHLQFSSSQHFEHFNRLETRVNTLNTTIRNHQKQIDILAADIIAQQIIHDADISSLKRQLDSVKNQTEALLKTTQKNADNIADANAQILGTELLLLEQVALVEKLNKSNEIWRANFQVVNRTFAELKKKLTLVVPVRGGGGIATIVV